MIGASSEEIAMRVLVTGFRGFVGHHLRLRLAARAPQSAFIEAPFDVTDRDAVDTVIGNVRPDACIHLAGISDPERIAADTRRNWSVNLDGALNIGESLLKHVPHARMVFASTSEVYGASFHAESPLTEHASLAPLNPYAASKAAADMALGVLARDGLQVVRFRPFNHTGTGQEPFRVVAAFARQVARVEAGLQRPVIEVGNLEGQRDFMDVQDVCDAYIDAIAPQISLQPGTILNLCSGSLRSVRSVLTDFLEISGVSAAVHEDPARVRLLDVAVTRGDASQAHRLLGWEPRVPWSRTLHDVLNDWRNRVRA
ncbi:GDP-mannose 4,6-dehydratase [Gluconobacter wancherniae]|uniref:GDP-mannose 4,6-dehydratase n=1 Tax=Gluconobacter wancherniae TaxID=1307955 RepID=UPI0030975055